MRWISVVSAFAGALLLGGCASVSAISLSQDKFQITANGLDGCGAGAAQRVAFQQAAAETIRRGYDKFVVLNTQGQSQVNGASWVYGGASFDRSFSHDLVVQMYRDGDPAGAQSLSARDTLGPKWQETVAKTGVVDCI